MDAMDARFEQSDLAFFLYEIYSFTGYAFNDAFWLGKGLIWGDPAYRVGGICRLARVFTF